ncbi:succinyl-CoA ligase-like protein subunit alpha [Pseudovirgaria hyperparasitica]|uniref:Succinyl-CoA ligase-like protein subunit alpha n=1 Tax=Pseudovirgaria hyperparasitica TaxID=470096 RepID=A0A6A6VS80_9PEZI|nr:succinyl-CoA ligase-like protein subunit alpha [Pseudovirgaria hyperparasitica]KAF2753005.1 succinyl-CoA ligase-like protein subunit alpha [Pseudovirgaria hyperparasitica]
MLLLRASQKSVVPKSLARRSFSVTYSRDNYADTIKNLQIGAHTRVMFQGFTGKQATMNAKASIEWGTNIVGGVKPNTESEHLGLPVLPSVRAAKEKLNPDATAIYVAAGQAAPAIEEAIEAEIPLIVAVAEHIPLHDILRISSILQTQSKSRLVGANAPGIISAIGRCRIGFQPLPCFAPGHVGIIAKSGTLSYETVGALTSAGLGQSTVIGMGGDIVAGTNFVEALTAFETDPDTHAIIMCGEIGGRTETDAAEWIADYKKRVKNPKPIAAVIGGVHARQGTIMGHAGAFALPGDKLAHEKVEILKNVGVPVVDHPTKLGSLMKTLMKQSGREQYITDKATPSQKRGYHTSRMINRLRMTPPSSSVNHTIQRRSLNISAQQASDLLNKQGINTSSTPSDSDARFLSITVDRSARSPSILVSPSTDMSTFEKRSKRFPYNYHQGPSKTLIEEAIAHLQLDAAPPAAKSQAYKLIKTLSTMYTATEAIDLTVSVSVDTQSDTLKIFNPSFMFDDSAPKSAKRQQEIHALRDRDAVDPAELEAEKDGIVYVKLGASSDRTHNIGTLVNGAGLAMNTVDALYSHGGKSANFLDTGGKATSETVKQSFNLILRDDRVKVIFVNIFGGLTLGDMIANGILLAFKELGLQEKGIPVVVRIKGTNEQEGQRIIAESGLKLEAFDRFDEAADRVVEIANGS